MSNLKTAAILIITLALLGLLAVAAWTLVVAIIEWFLALPTATMTAVAGLVGILSVPIITYFTTRKIEKGRIRETAVRQRKTEFYDKLISDLIGMFGLDGSGVATPEKMKETFASVPAPMITFASRGVIQAWNKFLVSARTNQASPTFQVDIMIAYEDLLREIRKDLGHPWFIHTKGELVGTFVFDAPDVMTKKTKVSQR